MKIFNILVCIYLIDIGLMIALYFLGLMSVKKEHNDTWGKEDSMEMGEANRRSDDWDEQHPVLHFFICFHYELNRKFEIPGDTYRSIKWFIQRGKRGYSDCDIWGFDCYLSKIIVKGLKDLQEQVHGSPCGMIGTQSISVEDEDGEEITEWKRIIGEIIWTFETTSKIQEKDLMPVFDERKRKSMESYVKRLNTPQKEEDKIFKDLPDKHYCLMTKEDTKRYKNGWKLFQKYYFDLWS